MLGRLSLSIIGVCVGVALLGACPSAQAQTVIGSQSLALKNGESFEVGKLYWVSHCRSMLKSTPEVEILEGPPGVTASVKEAMVRPRLQDCAADVKGGLLVISAKDIDDASYTKMTLRITYRTRDGDRKFSRVYNMSLFP